MEIIYTYYILFTTMTLPTVPSITADDIRTAYSEIPEGTDLSAAIATSTSLVQNSIIDNGCGVNYTQDQLKLIMIWLAAHIYQTGRGVLSSISAGSSSESYQMSTDFFLKGTPHGQMAMLLDKNHCLAQLMADTDQALQGKQSFPPSVISLHSMKQKSIRRYGC